MYEWRIELLSTKSIDIWKLSRLLFCLTGQGVRYNSSAVPGWQAIFPEDVKETVEISESADGERTDRLGEYLERYAQYDPKTTEGTIRLVFEAEPAVTDFSLQFGPSYEEDETYTADFVVGSTEIEDDDTEQFLSFVELVATVFERFPYEYGTFRTEHNPSIATHTGEELATTADRVVFLSADVVERMGEDVVSHAPTTKQQILEDGSVLLIAHPAPYGGPVEVRALRDYLCDHWPADSTG